MIEFIDDSHWLIRLQRPEEEWKTQYACFGIRGYRKGKGDVELSHDDLQIQRQLLKIDSRATGLEDGDERLVEVEIEEASEKLMPWEMKSVMRKFRGLNIGSASTN